MKQLLKILGQIESHIPFHEKVNQQVSQSTIGWQIDHSLMVINSVVEQLRISNPENYKWKFNSMRLLLQITNKIPRGKVKVPKSVQPIDVATIENLTAKLGLAKRNLAAMENLPEHSYFTHPIFGDLNLKSTIWFLKLHTNHHLKIIEDIRV